jgi:MerR family transcriptional regulator, copper efflux regulator
MTLDGDPVPIPAAIPIACSLDAASHGERADEWHALVASSVTSVQADPRAVRLVLCDSDAALTSAVALAQREKECCPFFDVSLTLDADRRTLVLAVPDGAEEVLAAFVALIA